MGGGDFDFQMERGTNPTFKNTEVIHSYAVVRPSNWKQIKNPLAMFYENSQYGKTEVEFRMKTYNHLFEQLCEYNNLLLAFNKAKKGKSKKEYVQKFEKNLKAELSQLQWELMTGIYKPAALTTFTIQDPKTRKISASHFRDRVVHHAICNMIEPIYEPRFIYDTFANRKGKGTLGTLKRFDVFARKISNSGKNGYVLKADIRKYFENVDHEVLFTILRKRIKDEQLLKLISIVLKNHKSAAPGKGMPLGNLTSQFFANVYLAELDNFVKHELRAKYYLRYVDDFVILSKNKAQLEAWKMSIDTYLSSKLRLTLHQDKTKILSLKGGVQLVGFRVFRHHRLLKRSNRRRFFSRLKSFKEGLATGELSKEHICLSAAGWTGYAMMANTYQLRQNVEAAIENMLGDDSK